MKVIIAIFSTLLLSACVTTREFSGPNGERAFLTKCNGGANDITDCYEAAAVKCEGRGYNILNTVDGSDGAVVSGNMIMNVNRRELTYTCK